MKKYVTFSGRATRSQYWLFALVCTLMFVIAALLDAAMGTDGDDRMGPIAALVVLVHLLPAISIFVRRMHDIDRTGWWYWLNLVPIVGPIIVLVFLCTRSTAGPNRFGPPTDFPSTGAQGGATLATPSSPATVEQLEKLANLRASGALDEAEFQKMKSDVLNKSAH